MKRRTAVFFVATAMAVSAGAATASAWAADETPAGPSLREAGAARGVLVGAAVSGRALRDGIEQPYLDTLKREFSMVTAENDMKFSFIHPEPDRYDFAAADKLVALAEANGQKVHGHTLAWYSQNPAWADALTDKAVAEKALEDHIKTVVGRYKGKVAVWDVVNEAINDGERGGLRNSVWLRTIGPDYIEKAFRWAHEADPAAKLYYNDYETGDDRGKSNAVYDLMRTLKAKGVPIDGVGIQAHSRFDRQTGPEYARNMNRLAALGLELQITELDVGIQLPATPEKLANQARVYRETADFCLRQPKCVGITTWGFTDKYSWIPTADPGFGAALPFDEEYKKKPAYDALLAALSSTSTGTPATPTNLVAETADKAVQLSWTGTTASGTTYEVRYGTSAGRLDQKLDVGANTTVRIPKLRNNATYTFAVVAKGAGGVSPQSAKVTGRPTAKLAKPIIGVPVPDQKTLELTWTPVPGATGYVVTHSGDGVTGGTQRTDVGNVVNYRLGGLTNGTSYKVSVLPYNADGDGPAATARSQKPATRTTPKVTAAETTGAVTVDGKLTEPEWRRLPIALQKETFRSTDNTAQAAITWDNEKIYFAGKVRDPKRVKDSFDIYQDDTFEVFLNGKGDLPKAYDTSSDRHYFLRPGDEAVNEQNGKTAGATWKWADTPGGYTLELSVTWASLGITPGQNGSKVGVDFSVDDDDDGGFRDGQLTAYGYEENYQELTAIGLADLTVRLATTKKAVTPIADCVADNGDGTFTARFGYDNANDGRVTIPVGANNKFTPGDADRGQPSTLARGRQQGFWVTYDSAALTWSLRGPDGVTRTATADSSTAKCTVVPAQTVFAEALGTGWESFSFNATVDPAAATVAHGGTHALGVTVSGAYGLAGLENKTAPVQLTPDSALEMWINLGSSTTARTFGFHSASGIEGDAAGPTVYFTVQPGGWVKKTFDRSDLGTAAQLGSFYLQDVSGSADAQPALYLDDVRVLNVKPRS